MIELSLTTDEAQALVDILGDAEATNDAAQFLKQKLLCASRDEDEPSLTFNQFLERARNSTPGGV